MMTLNNKTTADLDKLRRNLRGGVWATEPVTEQPVLHLQNWRIIEFQGAFQLNGWVPENLEGRVSSPIRAIDLRTRRVTTRSGRVYQLTGRSGRRTHPDAEYVAVRYFGKRPTRIHTNLAEVRRHLRSEAP